MNCRFSSRNLNRQAQLTQFIFFKMSFLLPSQRYALDNFSAEHLEEANAGEENKHSNIRRCNVHHRALVRFQKLLSLAPDKDSTRSRHHTRSSSRTAVPDSSIPSFLRIWLHIPLSSDIFIRHKFPENVILMRMVEI